MTNVLALLLLLSSPRLQQEDGFVPLFNGRDLSGWANVNCAPETWRVRDGIIHNTGKPTCELRTERMYENFVLELEYKHLVAEGNAGVFIWGDALTARGQPFVRAIEIQVLDGRNTENSTSHGDVFAIHGATMTPDRPHPAGWARSLPRERRARGVGEWNHYRITARDGVVTLAVNGAEVSGGRDVSPRKGYIHLESEGGVVEWRNIRIKELPSAGTLAPAHVAREYDGFAPLYTGTDFRGWRHGKEHEGHWASNDWKIACDGAATGDAATLWTERSFGDVVVITDWRVTGDAPVADALPIRLGSIELPAEARERLTRLLAVPAPAPRWRRATMTKQRGRLTLAIDGDVIMQDEAVPGTDARGPIGLRHNGRPIELGNVFVKELSR